MVIFSTKSRHCELDGDSNFMLFEFLYADVSGSRESPWKYSPLRKDLFNIFKKHGPFFIIQTSYIKI